MKPVLFSLCALAAVSLALPAFAQSGAGTPPLTPDFNTNAPLPQSLHLSGNSQRATVTTDKAVYRRGQSVRVTFRITNPTGKAVTYNFATSQKYDITVQNSAGVVLWDWAQGRMFSQNLTAVTINSHSSQVFLALWNEHDQKGRSVPSGAYTITAKLLSDNRPAITGGVIVNTDRDPNNMGSPTQTPAVTGAIRQIDVASPVSARKTILIK